MAARCGSRRIRAGTLYMEIDTTTFGSTLRISQQIVYSNGNLPIYLTINRILGRKDCAMPFEK